VVAAAVILLINNIGTSREIEHEQDAGNSTTVKVEQDEVPTISPKLDDENLDPSKNNLPSPGESAGAYSLWSEIEMLFEGPISSGLSNERNPFQLEFTVTFYGPGGKQFVVPGFYQGDGQGGMDGNIWQVRFTPDQEGEWRYFTGSSDELLDGHSGTFQVVPQLSCEDELSANGANFDCLGRLMYSGEHYLAFSNGSYWLKGGVNEPEDLLAPHVNAGFPNKEMAIDYLAEQSVNSIYLVLHNIDGDGKNVWPWYGSTQAEAKNQTAHFDIDKLQEWEGLFQYIQDRGIVLHLVLEDDGAWTGFDRQMYYREIVARFAHHKGIVWNISEEYNENYSSDEVKQFAQMLRELDPYDHPITVHHAGRTNQWQPFLNDENIDLTSFQSKSEPQYNEAVYWFGQSTTARKIIPISFDETGQLEAHERDLARQIIWSVYLGGANFELFTILRTGYQEFELLFSDMARARKFIEQLPFDEMSPCNELIDPERGYCFSKPGGIIVVYLPQGELLSVDLSDLAESSGATWFDPRTGEKFSTDQAVGGASQRFSAPGEGDWVLYIGSSE
jgi:hypothetical protein